MQASAADNDPPLTTVLYRRFGKRSTDVVVAIVSLVLFAPVFLLIAAMVKATSSGPVFFSQVRLGKNKKTFRLIKFRTMTHKHRATDDEISWDHPEVTPVGRIIRRLKLDETPQLWNVLRGEMSLVGPRPDVPRSDSIEDSAYHRRFDVPPGLTGLAQVHGNTCLPWRQRWQYDACYADHYSLSKDVWIIWRTFGVILFGENRFIVAPATGETCNKS